MYCRNCGSEVSEKAVMCVSCGVPPLDGTKYCSNCKAETDPNAVVCVKCGVSLQRVGAGGGYDWLTALLLCFFLGPLGVHNFYTKNTTVAIIQLLTLGGCGIWALIDLVRIISDSYTDGNGKKLVRK